MKRESNTDISFFQRYLTLWVIVCMVLGVLIGKYLPGIPAFLNQFEYAKVSIPMAILIWLMIYPMMMKVDFQSIFVTAVFQTKEYRLALASIFVPSMNTADSSKEISPQSTSSFTIWLSRSSTA